MRSIALAFLFFALRVSAAEPATGPATEKRFPPLKVPDGFRATLFACDPLIEYPSVIAIGPRPGTLFVAHDYMTGLGTDGIVKSEVRLIEDSDGDGYADKSTVYAKGFNSIQGLAYHNGTLYVMHSPFLTALRDTKGSSAADERKNLLEGLGLPPEKNPVRLHGANGVVVGHDGWLYLALGDHGVDVTRPEGDRLVLNGGGVLRCRPDGGDLHVFATGTRNIYDISLDEDLNVFFRDNENDGGTFMIRVCHSFFSADHGYPYKYYEHPDEALRPIGDFGLGSSAGGVCYLETQFPVEYRGNLFNCEWGRSIVRCAPKREGSGFASLREIEFAAGADNDPYGFKPTDIVVDRDGSMLVADWADGQRPKRGRGRIYRISYVGQRAKPEEDVSSQPLLQLGAASYRLRAEAQSALILKGRDTLDLLRVELPKRSLSVRQRSHAVWLFAQVNGRDNTKDLFDLAENDVEPRVRAQAVRAIADLTDPVLVKHKLDAGAGDAESAARLAKLAAKNDPRVTLEAVIALGRLRWAGSPQWLHENLNKPDATLAHAAMMTLRKSENWPAILKLLDLPENEPIRAIALRALAEQAMPEIVEGLVQRLREETRPARQREYLDLLARIARKPGEWVYWGFRPPPRPANTAAWEKTETIETSLDSWLQSARDPRVRLFVLKRMQREKIPIALKTLLELLKSETVGETLLAVIESLREKPADSINEAVAKVIADKKKPPAARLAALELYVRDAGNAERLLTLSQSLEDGAVLAEAIKLLAKLPKLDASLLLLSKIDSPDARVRAAAIDAAAQRSLSAAVDSVRKRLADDDANVRRAAAAAAGPLKMASAIPELLKLTSDRDGRVRRSSFESLCLLKEPKAVPIAVAALSDPMAQDGALRCIAELGSADNAKALAAFARQSPSSEVLQLVTQALAKWSDRPEPWRLLLDIADLQGSTGVALDWLVTGPIAVDDEMLKRFGNPQVGIQQPGPTWRRQFGTNFESRIQLNFAKGGATERMAMTDVSVRQPTEVQFLAGSSAAMRIYLNGKQVFNRAEAQPYRVDSERFDATLSNGINRILVHFPDAKGDINFHLRFRRKSGTALHEKLTQAALTRGGNVENGRKLFFNIDRTQCLKCHRVGEQGDKIGPDLTGVGNRFSRIHLVESVLEPSRAIASSFQTLVIVTSDGKSFTGVKSAEDDKTIELGDREGKKHVIAKAVIESQRTEKLSTMPEGLEKSLTPDEFVDLIAFLASQKETRPKK